MLGNLRVAPFLCIIHRDFFITTRTPKSLAPFPPFQAPTTTNHHEKISQGFSTSGSIPFWSCSKAWKAPCIIAWFFFANRQGIKMFLDKALFFSPRLPVVSNKKVVPNRSCVCGVLKKNGGGMFFFKCMGYSPKKPTVTIQCSSGESHASR